MFNNSTIHNDGASAGLFVYFFEVFRAPHIPSYQGKGWAGNSSAQRCFPRRRRVIDLMFSSFTAVPPCQRTPPVHVIHVVHASGMTDKSAVKVYTSRRTTMIWYNLRALWLPAVASIKILMHLNIRWKSSHHSRTHVSISIYNNSRPVPHTWCYTQPHPSFVFVP